MQPLHEKVLLKLEPVADKFHLLLNLREKLKELMARKQKLLPHVEATPSAAIADKAREALSAHPPPPALATEKAPTSFRNRSPRPRAVPSGSATSPPEEPPSQVSRSNRSARFEAVHALHQQAWSEAGDCSPPEDVPPNSASISGRRDLSGA